MAADRREVGRLALRHEGLLWVAYYAPRQDSMIGAVYIGSVLMSAVADRGERKTAFMKLMQEIVGDFIEKAAGVRPDWNAPHAAPEGERSRPA